MLTLFSASKGQIRQHLRLRGGSGEWDQGRDFQECSCACGIHEAGKEGVSSGQGEEESYLEVDVGSSEVLGDAAIDGGWATVSWMDEHETEIL